MASDQDRNDTGELWSASSVLTRIMGFSVFASLFSNAYAFDSVKLLVLGSIIETGRRLCQWLYERLRFREFFENSDEWCTSNFSQNTPSPHSSTKGILLTSGSSCFWYACHE